MSDDRARLDAARRRLAHVQDRISRHPLSADDFLRAREVVAAEGGRDAGTADGLLREQGLPGVGRQAVMMAVGLPSLARLNRRRLRLEQRIARLEGGLDRER